MKYAPRTTAKAFTLIELMVSIALFSIVISTVATSYLNLLSIERQVRATNDIANNLNFVVDTMARSIRTGTNYQCGGVGGGNCSTANSAFAFKDDSGNTNTYVLDSTNHAIGECPNQTTTCVVGSGTYAAITDPRITVNRLDFYVRGVGTGDNTQPFVTFVVTGTLTIDAKHAPVSFSIQSSAVQRQIDI